MAALTCSVDNIGGACEGLASPAPCIVGFHPRQASAEGGERPAARRSFSLLTRELEAVPVPKDVEMEEEDDDDEEGCSNDACSDGEWEGAASEEDLVEAQWVELGSGAARALFRTSTASSVAGFSEASSSHSAPIAIPATCYFKDEVQRAALAKLNRKRAWYQQQMEAERLQAKNAAPKSKAAAAAGAPCSRPLAHHHHHKHNYGRPSQPGCV